MSDCPLCHNDNHVYDHWVDPKYDDCVCCSIHGMMICEKSPDGKDQTSTPRMDSLDGRVI